MPFSQSNFRILQLTVFLKNVTGLSWIFVYWNKHNLMNQKFFFDESKKFILVITIHKNFLHWKFIYYLSMKQLVLIILHNTFFNFIASTSQKSVAFKCGIWKPGNHPFRFECQYVKMSIIIFPISNQTYWKLLIIWKTLATDSHRLTQYLISFPGQLLLI